MQKKQSKQLISSYLGTPLGTVLTLTDATHLYLLKFLDQDSLERSIEFIRKSAHATIKNGTSELTISLQNELTQYFAGSLQNFSIPIQLYGTSFQKKSWQALTKKLYGSTTSYSHQSTTIGNPKAHRAIANTNKNNPIAIIVPCHRVIKSNGELSGYNSGIHRKQALLNLEK